MVEENARQGLEQLRVKMLAEPEALSEALTEIQSKLDLPTLPQRMECYDISNIQGTSAVGSMVVFERGLPKKSHYRRFRIKTVTGADDYAMIREVIGRRFKKSSNSDESSWSVVPDLIMIDGGKGQLNAARSAMRELGVDSIPCASIAKENEWIFLPKAAKPVVLPANSPALFLIQRMRDEAHRFAIGYFQRVHKRAALSSALDSIPGIGTKRKRKLLKKFGSIKGIREATVEELSLTEGITVALAERIKEHL
jgi:excinuclease ABC subunit C